MRVVKGFVVLAILLLIPSIGYFQKQHFESRMKPQLAASVLTVLEAEGVRTPSVQMDYLDAVIAGRVDSDRRREEVAAKVDALPGVRLVEEGNRLHTFGWLRISRTNGLYHAAGVVSKKFPLQLPSSLEPQGGWNDDVERRVKVELPEALWRWGEFLRYYFRESGNRSVELRRRALTMRGDATAGLRSDWLSKASEVVSKDEVFDEFSLHPSTYHFPGFTPDSVKEEALDELRREFKLNVVIFEEGSLELLITERAKTLASAQVILRAGKEGRYVVGGHPAREGNVTANGQLARKRAEEIVNLLVELGVAREQLEAVSFGVTSDDRRDNQVEIVVK